MLLSTRMHPSLRPLRRLASGHHLSRRPLLLLLVHLLLLMVLMGVLMMVLVRVILAVLRRHHLMLVLRGVLVGCCLLLSLSIATIVVVGVVCVALMVVWGRCPMLWLLRIILLLLSLLGISPLLRLSLAGIRGAKHIKKECVVCKYKRWLLIYRSRNQ